MPLSVRFFSAFRDVTGTPLVTLENAPKNVRVLLDELVERFGPRLKEQLFDSETGKLRETTIILVNGHSVHMLQGLETELKNGDEVTGDLVAILEPIGGG